MSTKIRLLITALVLLNVTTLVYCAQNFILNKKNNLALSAMLVSTTRTRARLIKTVYDRLEKKNEVAIASEIGVLSCAEAALAEGLTSMGFIEVNDATEIASILPVTSLESRSKSSVQLPEGRRVILGPDRR
jgi:hypothetical protein